MLLVAALLSGCAGNSIESRKMERASAYSLMPPEMRADIDAGRIRVGMNEDAVFMAWGKPSQILESETEAGHIVTWLYEGGWMQEQRYWAYRNFGRDNDAWVERVLVTDYEPRAYVRAEIAFEDGVVKRWRTLPRPAP